MIGISSSDQEQNIAAKEPQEEIISNHHDIVYKYCIQPEISEEVADASDF